MRHGDTPCPYPHGDTETHGDMERYRDMETLRDMETHRDMETLHVHIHMETWRHSIQIRHGDTWRHEGMETH